MVNTLDPEEFLTSDSDSDTLFLRTWDSDMDSDKVMTSATGTPEFYTGDDSL